MKGMFYSSWNSCEGKVSEERINIFLCDNWFICYLICVIYQVHVQLFHVFENLLSEQHLWFRILKSFCA